MAHFKNQRGHDPKKQETILREGSHLKFLPTSSKDLEARGWEACDIILVTGMRMSTTGLRYRPDRTSS